MQNRRLLFSVIIKLLVFFGVFLLLLVLVNSLFTGNSTTGIQQETTSKEIQTVSIDTHGMFKGQIRKTRWNNKEVAILFRQFPEKLSNNENHVEENLDASIDKKDRSRNKEYFVFFNFGDSFNCPLFYIAGEFKDVCTSNKFDESGRMLNGDPSSFKFRIPPHYFIETSVIIGKWKPD